MNFNFEGYSISMKTANWLHASCKHLFISRQLQFSGKGERTQAFNMFTPITFYPLGNSCALLRYITLRAAITYIYMYMYLNHLLSHPLKSKNFLRNYWPCRAPCCLPLSAPRASILRSRSPHPPKSGAVRCGCCSSQALSAATADSRSDATSLSSSCALRAVAASNVHT